MIDLGFGRKGERGHKSGLKKGSENIKHHDEAAAPRERARASPDRYCWGRRRGLHPPSNGRGAETGGISIERGKKKRAFFMYEST